MILIKLCCLVVSHVTCVCSVSVEPGPLLSAVVRPYTKQEKEFRKEERERRTFRGQWVHWCDWRLRLLNYGASLLLGDPHSHPAFTKNDQRVTSKEREYREMEEVGNCVEMLGQRHLQVKPLTWDWKKRSHLLPPRLSPSEKGTKKKALKKSNKKKEKHGILHQYRYLYLSSTDRGISLGLGIRKEIVYYEVINRN